MSHDKGVIDETRNQEMFQLFDICINIYTSKLR